MCLCLFLNELLAVLDVDLSFDGSFHTTAGEVEDFCLIVVNGYALDAFGGKSSGVVGGSTAGIVVVNDSAEGTDALYQGLEDEFVIFDGETVCVVEVIFRRNGVAAETVVTDCRSRRGNFLNLEGGLTCTLAEQYGGVGGNLFRIQLCESDHAVLCIDFSAIYINIRRYFNCGGGEEGDVAEFVGVERELRGFFEEEVAIRFVGREAESAVAVEFHELVAHFEAVAAGIEGLFELALRDNCFLLSVIVVVNLIRPSLSALIYTSQLNHPLKLKPSLF